MQVIGLIGGTGWPATRDYYETINRLAQQRLGRLHGANLRLWSFDFQTLLDIAEQPGAIDLQFANAAQSLKTSGAQLLALASNTGHLYLDGVRLAQLPVVHIAKACASAMAAHGAQRVGILATRRACDGGVFNVSLQSAGIAPCYLDAPLAEQLEEVIFSELETAMAGPKTRRTLLAAAEFFTRQGITDILLGCTELRLSLVPAELLTKGAGEQPPFRIWDSTDVHCAAIVDAALASATG
jgi:aspartate racemase